MEYPLAKNPPQARRGMAMIVAVAMLAIIATLVILSSQGAVAARIESGRTSYQVDALGALETVLARREVRLAQLSRRGDPAEFANWKNYDFETQGGKNYGVDVVGNCRVAWKIEPIIIKSLVAPGAGATTAKYITNPAVDGSASDDPNQLSNDIIYLYRLIAESRYENPGVPDSAPNRILARARGARFVSITDQPLFRYVIFYAQRGPKGDLEFSHGDTVQVQGNVHSNGAIYMGADTSVTDYNALTPSSTQITRLGPNFGANGTLNTPVGGPIAGDDQAIKVVGVDGIYRLSKPITYGALNGYPLSNPPAGLPSPVTGGYDLTALNVGLDKSKYYVQGTSFADFATATNGGTQINPQRVRDDSKLITRLASDDTKRTINMKPLLGSIDGVSAPAANDSRDEFRQLTGGQTWKAKAGTDFSNQARSSENGGTEVKLIKSLQGRALEPQQLANVYEATSQAARLGMTSLLPGDIVIQTDLSPRAAFVYMEPPTSNIDNWIQLPTSTSTQTGAIDTDGTIKEEYLTPRYRVNTTAEAREAAGYYMALAMGAGDNDATAYASRSTTAGKENSSWTLNAGAAPSDKVGLIIRERMRPDYSIYPGSVPGTGVSPSDPEYKPFAYGKHARPSDNPFTVVQIGLPWVRTYNSGSNSPNSVNVNRLSMSQSYSSGFLSFQAAAGQGNDPSTGNTQYTNNMFTHDHWQMANLGPAAFDRGDVKVFQAKIASIPTARAEQKVGIMLYGADLSACRPDTASLLSAVTNTATAWTVDNVGGLVHGSLLQVDGEIVRVRTVTAPNSITVERGKLGPTAGAHSAGATITHVGGQPWTGRKISQSGGITSSATAITLDSAAGLSAGQMILIDDEVILITAIASNTLTVLRGQDGTTAAIHPDQAPILRPGRAAYAALLVSPHRGIFLQRRERPTTSSTFAMTYWNGNGAGTPGVAPTLVGAWAPDSDATPGLVTIDKAVIGWNQGTNDVTNFPTATVSSTTYPDVTGAITWSDESTNFTITNYGRRFSYKGRYRESRSQRRTGLTLKTGSFPATIGFWDPTTGTNGDIGDSGKTLRIYPASGTTAIYSQDAYSISNLITGSYYQTLYWWDTTYYTPSTSVAPPTTLGPLSWGVFAPGLVATPTPTVASHTNVKYYQFPLVSAASATWSAIAGVTGANGYIAYGIDRNSYMDAATKTLTTWSDQCSPSGSLNNKVIPSGPYAGWTVKVVNTNFGFPADSSLTYPAWPTITLPSNPTGDTPWSNMTDPKASATAGSDFRFCIARGGAGTGTWTFDCNPWTTRCGPWSSTPQYQYYPVSTIRSGASPDLVKTYAHRPDMWCTANATFPSGGAWNSNPTDPWLISPYPGSSATGSAVISSGKLTGCTNSLDDIKPWSGTSVPTEVWVAMRQHSTDRIRYYYSAGTTAPSSILGSDDEAATLAKGWTRINQPDGTAVESDISQFGGKLLVGACLQSGDTRYATSGLFSQISLVRADNSVVTPDSIGGSGSLSVTKMNQYLASQYQVFFGTRDITTDFFTYHCEQAPATPPAGYVDRGTYDPARRLAQEDWFFHTREFWSQSRWWNADDVWPLLTVSQKTTSPFGDDTVGKLFERDDSGNAGCGSGDNANNRNNHDRRRWFAKTTVINLNMTEVQDYLKNRLLKYATNDSTDDANADATSIFNKPMKSSFNGLIYIARTNRAPWVPKSVVPATQTTRYARTTRRPWSYAGNDNDNFDNFYTSFPSDPWTLTTDPQAQYLVPNASYIAVTPRFKPQDFHHGVMIRNAADIDWNGWLDPETGNATFGACKLSIVTPNQIWLVGNVNTTTHNVRKSSKDATMVNKIAPMAVMADAINLLSQGWSMPAYQADGLTVDTRAITGGGILATRNGTAAAANTTYNTCLVTHNQPTTKDRVRLGEGAAFVNTMLFTENWSGRTMTYAGSLVVMNSRRYTRSFLLEQGKNFGSTPFGWAGWHCLTTNGGTGYLDWVCNGGKIAGTHNVSTNTDGSVPVYSQPTRNLSFNEDLLTAEGTPPFTPFGVTVSGLGSWSRIEQ